MSPCLKSEARQMVYDARHPDELVVAWIAWASTYGEFHPYAHLLLECAHDLTRVLEIERLDGEWASP